MTHEVVGRPAEDVARRLAAEMKRTIAHNFGVIPSAVLLLRRGGVIRTTSGKIQRVAMRRLFLDGGLTAIHADYEPRLAAALSLPQSR